MPSQDLLMPWGDQICQWRAGDRSQMTRIHELLAVRGRRVSYSTLRRFTVKGNWGSARRATPAGGAVSAARPPVRTRPSGKRRLRPRRLRSS